MPRNQSPLSGLAADIRAGRVIGSDAALILAEQAVSEAAAQRPAARRPAGDEYARLFPAHAPLGPELPTGPPARASAAPYTDDELHAALFGDVDFRPTHSAGVGAPPGHAEYHGVHVHEHSDYNGGTHSHAHTHAGDAAHAPSNLHPHPAG